MISNVKGKTGISPDFRPLIPRFHGVHGFACTANYGLEMYNKKGRAHWPCLCQLLMLALLFHFSPDSCQSN